MERMNITDAIAFDRHFAEYGAPLTAELRSAASPRVVGRGEKWLRSPRPASSRGEGAERSEAGEGGRPQRCPLVE
jgi:hypothetical protein